MGFTVLTQVNMNSNNHPSSAANIILFNPFNAEATFIKGTKIWRLLKTFQTQPCWY